ncbi:MetQ/NlpA family ABC transporter substrate-binding protein [Viridibacillus sp. FSL E2-0187]|uniref:MetQ/NlpA family ABC transporter substrate-binding protein n=1 Tax=Viridibacillus TaxID=496496 RepID=UPI00187B46EB|nr:MetQ/NlpA family ABC transporter substrate-binding protein [Viridibacillus sp. JNUCC-6]QOV13169.1 MetQ/NlpA family ABC transporter substrate-binding protein [Viridibacillus sp. JNUCC-6]
MKKLVAGILTGVLALSLAACGKSEEKLVIGAANTPHAEILEKAEPLLEKEGIKLKIERYQDFVLPNKDLANKDLDANFFQHIPYLELQNKQNGYDFVNVGGVHVEPIGIYSKKYKKLEDLPEGATILLSNSVSDHGRMLSLLEAKGLITLKEGVDKTAAEIKDITKNPKNLKFDANTAPEMLVQMYKNDEGDAVLINSNFAIDAGISPGKDAIALEDKESDYINVIAVRKEDENNEKIKKLVKVLHSKEMQDYILKEWNGDIVPVSE